MLIGADPRLDAIVADAATLADRLSADWLPATGDASTVLAEERLARWNDRATQDDAALFRRRLEWLGWTPETVAPRLGLGRLKQTPEWARVFAAALQRTGDSAAASAHPFGPALVGFAAEAVERLSPACRTAFAPAAMAALVDDLYVQLSHLAAPALQLEFALFRGEPGDGRERFTAFVAGLTAGGLWRFFAEYAALARLLSITVLHWVGHVSALAADFLADRSTIAARFGGDDPRCIVTARPGLSDAHNRGRSVVAVICANGLHLIYKPRPVGIEAAWFALLGELDGVCGSFRTLAVLSRADHGWVETITHQPCRDAAEAKLFYRRSGNLLALLYALEASDCFHENILADAGFPVLIDMETLMHHVLRPAAELCPAETAAGDILFDSVLRAGFLPVWEAGRGGVCVDISGLGAQRGQPTPYLRRRWSDINSDRMALQQEPIVITTDDHLPKLAGVALRAADFTEAIVQGFGETYSGLMDRRAALLQDAGAIERLGDQVLRLVFHPTRLYGLLLKRLAAPRALRSGVERSIELDVIARFYVDSREKLPFNAMLGAELAALERLDIPYFSLRADAEALMLPDGGTIERAFAETAIARVRGRLARFNGRDLALQSEFIRASLVMSATAVHVPALAIPAVRTAGRIAAASPDRMIAAAVAIGDLLERRAIRVADEEAIWIAPQLLPGTGQYELRVQRMDLYGGVAGVAVFLAALARVTGRFRALALAALVPVRRFVATTDRRGLLAAGYTVGGATGIGSFVYALTRCATLLEAPALLADASTAASLLDPALLEADSEHDVMSGAAGAALGLLALHDAAGDPAVLARAQACGEHLLAAAIPAGGGAAWGSARHPPTTGLSHGAAGVALALSRLARATGDARFDAAAQGALAFEAWSFDPARRNWRDLRHGSTAPVSFMNTWCHGALGIGLARVAALRLRDDEGMRRDVDAAVALSTGGWLGAKDGLCCGNMARCDLLMMASASSGKGSSEAAATVAALVLDRADRNGGFALSGMSGTDFFDPSLYQGLAGIGYQLLRLAAPAALPSLLVWD